MHEGMDAQFTPKMRERLRQYLFNSRYHPKDNGLCLSTPDNGAPLSGQLMETADRNGDGEQWRYLY